MHRHHKRALWVVAAAAVLDVALGLAYSWVTPGLVWWHGLYCALASAVTLGGDVNPANKAGYAVMSLICLTVVPLFGATFALFTSGLTGGDVKKHVDRKLSELPRRPDSGESR